MGVGTLVGPESSVSMAELGALEAMAELRAQEAMSGGLCGLCLGLVHSARPLQTELSYPPKNKFMG